MTTPADPTLPVALPAPTWSGVVDRAVEAALATFVADIGHTEDCECDYDYERNVYTDDPCKSQLDYLRDVCHDAIFPALAVAGLLRSGFVEPSPPRTWQLPPEPGPEVTAVRDADGDLWVRVYDEWRLNNHKSRAVCSWTELLSYGPLIDATEEPS